MSTINKFSNEKIREIAEEIEMGDVCYINAIVHNCEYRENWFAFKQNALEEYVREEISYRYDEEE